MVYEQTHTEDGVPFTVRMRLENFTQQPSSVAASREAMQAFLNSPTLVAELYDHGYDGVHNTRAVLYAQEPKPMRPGERRELARLANQHGMNEGSSYGSNLRWWLKVATSRGQDSRPYGFLADVRKLQGVMDAWPVTVEVLPSAA